MNRTEYIANYFVDKISEEQFKVCLLTPQGLRQIGDTTGNGRFGWAPPVLVEDDEDDVTYLFFVCPEVIADQTAELSDSDLEPYLLSLSALMHAHVVYSDTPVSERVELIDSVFADHHTDMLHTVSAVQLGILDREADST